MAKEKKITTEELESINGIISKMREAQLRYGALALQVASVKDAMTEQRNTLSQLEASMGEQREKLQDTYGDVNIDLQTGAITVSKSPAAEVVE